jgi:lycopene cyclase domain-containing protein
MPEYTLLTLLAVGVVVALDLAVVRTRLLATVAFWITLAIVWGFQILVDGWLTKLWAPIVIYDEASFSGIRIFLDSPIEDFGFGFAMIVATLMGWEVLGRRPASPGGSGARRRPAAHLEAGGSSRCRGWPRRSSARWTTPAPRRVTHRCSRCWPG